MPFNRHTHQWGSNSHGSFCLTCGEFRENYEKDEKHSDFFLGPLKAKDTLMWAGEKISEDKIEEGDNFDPYSR